MRKGKFLVIVCSFLMCIVLCSVNASSKRYDPVTRRPEPVADSEPEQSELEQSEPEQSEPEQSEPEQSEPEQSEPEQSEPEQSEPEQSEPEQSEPEQSEPEQSEPVESGFSYGVIALLLFAVAILVGVELGRAFAFWKW